MNSHRNQYTGIILAGGKSRRMGTDKGLLNFQGQPFIEHIIKTIKPFVGRLFIVSDNEAYDRFGIERIEDLIKDSGPLAGLYTGLVNSDTKLNLVLSCDVPLIKTELIDLLLNESDPNSDIVQFKHKDKPLPLIAVYKSDCAKNCLQLLRKGDNRLLALQEQLDCLSIDIPENLKQQIINVNTPEEFKTINHEC